MINSILAWLADLFQGLFGDPKRQLNKLEVNLENSRKRLELIRHTHYPKFQKDALHYLNRDGALWFIRKDLESARYYYTGGREGYAVSDRVEDTFKVYLLDPRFKALKEMLQETEKKVVEMETAKGYAFVSVNDHHIIYKEISTGKVLSPADSNHV
jgi:diphthamide synthase subunit DPH2